MAEVQGSATCPVSQWEVWRYLLQIDNWIQELQGYDGHTLEPDGSMLVRMRGEVGFMTKVSRLRVSITEQEPPHRLTIVLKGLSDPLKGDGELVTEPVAADGTKIIYRLALAAHGIAGPVLNEFLEVVLPEAIGDLAARIADRLAQRSPGAVETL